MTRTILLLGMTGTGKSSFISFAHGKATVPSNLVVGSPGNITSCTEKVQAFEVVNPSSGSGESVLLVDTPGFNSTDKTDYEQLQLVVDWLNKQSNTTIDGILYLHDITQWHVLRQLSMQPKDVYRPPGAFLVSTNHPSDPNFKPKDYPGSVAATEIMPFNYTTESAWKILTDIKFSSTSTILAKDLADGLGEFCTEFQQMEKRGLKATISETLRNGLFSGLFHKISRPKNRKNGSN